VDVSGLVAVKFRVAAKSRVAPLKELSIPRLELQAAVLASRLCKTIQEETRMQFKEIILFTDSTITLAWIRSKGRRFNRGCPQNSNIRRPRLKNRFCSNFAQIYVIISENAPYIFLGQMLF
jgi:ribonuclease HI